MSRIKLNAEYKNYNNDKLFIDIKKKWVYFYANIDHTGNNFKITKEDLIKRLGK